MNKKKVVHDPVLVHEVIEHLHIKKHARYIDATLGAGGHTIEIIKQGGFVLGIDDDEKMLTMASERIKATCLSLNRKVEGCFKSTLGNFRNIKDIAERNNFAPVEGILMDLGLSSVHYDMDDRGFSFSDLNAPLDMRLNPEEQNIKASDLLNVLNSSQLENLFAPIVGRKKAIELSKETIQRREKHPFALVGDLVSISERIMPLSKINPATKPFMALRIAVNTELENLQLALPQAMGLLADSGILEVISFHSLEDRIVKDTFQNMADQNIAQIITRKPIIAKDRELQDNPRSRSAKLRIIQKNEK